MLRLSNELTQYTTNGLMGSLEDLNDSLPKSNETTVTYIGKGCITVEYCFRYHVIYQSLLLLLPEMHYHITHNVYVLSS